MEQDQMVHGQSGSPFLLAVGICYLAAIAAVVWFSIVELGKLFG